MLDAEWEVIEPFRSGRGNWEAKWGRVDPWADKGRMRQNEAVAL